MLSLVLALAAQAAPVARAAAPAGLNPHANELFDRDADLRAWALKLFDGNHDGWLTIYEAQPAIRMFEDIADANRDGRVTTHEYARARAFVVARW